MRSAASPSSRSHSPYGPRQPGERVALGGLLEQQRADLRNQVPAAEPGSGEVEHARAVRHVGVQHGLAVQGEADELRVMRAVGPLDHHVVPAGRLGEVPGVLVKPAEQGGEPGRCRPQLAAQRTTCGARDVAEQVVLSRGDRDQAAGAEEAVGGIMPGELLAEVVNQLGCHGHLRRSGRGLEAGSGDLAVRAECAVDVAGQGGAERLDAAQRLGQVARVVVHGPRQRAEGHAALPHVPLHYGVQVVRHRCAVLRVPVDLWTCLGSATGPYSPG